MNVLRKFVLALIVLVGLLALSALFTAQLGLHRQTLKACFDNVQGLRSGAEIRIAGVAVGTVGNVRPNPQDKGCLAEVEMRLATSYELRVPSDAEADVETAGGMGSSYVNIDVRQASGAPAVNYSYLKSKQTAPPLSVEETVRAARAAIALYEASKAADNAQKTGIITKRTNQ